LQLQLLQFNQKDAGATEVYFFNKIYDGAIENVKDLMDLSKNYSQKTLFLP
jgi:hypothetical protein